MKREREGEREKEAPWLGRLLKEIWLQEVPSNRSVERMSLTAENLVTVISLDDDDQDNYHHND